MRSTGHGSTERADPQYHGWSSERDQLGYPLRPSRELHQLAHAAILVSVGRDSLVMRPLTVQQFRIGWGPGI
jgi:hypothetical protein